MPIQVSYPGVYLEEIPGGQPTVAGVSTASTAFVDFFSRGPMDKATRITNMQDFNRIFGGLDRRSEASYGISQYFLNGGETAWVVRTGDGTAVASSMDVPIKTPGLQARVQYSTQDYNKAKQAADAAEAAATKAAQALSDSDGAGIRSNTDDAAKATQDAAEATREAAVQARAASDELAIAIAQAQASSGPTASRTADAAQASADAAQSSADAAEQTPQVATAALDSSTVAEQALKVGNNARTTQSQANDVLAVFKAADAAHDSAEDAAKQWANNKDIDDPSQLDTVQKAATSASASATQAANQALAAAQAAQAVAKSMSESADADTKTAGEGALSAAQDAVKAARQGVVTASDVDWQVKTAATGDDAEAALTATQAALTAAMGAAANSVAIAGQPKAAANGNGNGSDPLAEAQGNADVKKGVTFSGTAAYDTATTLLSTLVTNATNAAKSASALAAKDGAASGGSGNGNGNGNASTAPPPPTIGDVTKAAIDAIDAASRAAQAAGVNATGAANDAKVAADSVTSSDPAMAATAAEGSTQQAAKVTDEAVTQAGNVKMQIFQANTAAVSAGTAAGTAADAKPAENATPQDQAQTAANTAGLALTATDATVTAAEAVESAAVSVANLAVAASKSADAAAQSAEAAVMANEEASQNPTLVISAANPGLWGDNITVTLQVETGGTTFSLQVQEKVMSNGVIRVVNSETYNNLTVDDTNTSADPAVAYVNDASSLVVLSQYGPKVAGAWPEAVSGKFLSGGADGGLASASQLTGSMRALDKIAPDIFNILCLPAVANYSDAEASSANAEAQKYAGDNRAFYIVDIPAKVDSVTAMQAWAADYGNAMAYNMATYFPRLIMPDPLANYRPRNVGSSGTIAGIYARTDTTRGVWKAPAGVDAVIQGADVAVPLTDDQNGQLNPRGINVLRQFAIYGNIVWGARTLAGADQLSSEYKYINVRRLMNYIEESIFQSMKWAVFEPNDETLWGKIRLQINGFLAGLFSDGAFQGATPAQAYFVRCDGTTTTPLDIDLGIVNVVVGVAPSKPAEFVILQFQQIAGQTAS